MEDGLGEGDGTGLKESCCVLLTKMCFLLEYLEGVGLGAL